MAKKRRRIKAGDILAAMEGTRISMKDRDPELFYYEMRHGDLDWSTPVDIEEQVAVNFFGTLVTETPLELTDIVLPDGRGILTPTWKEKRVICEKVDIVCEKIDAFKRKHTQGRKTRVENSI